MKYSTWLGFKPQVLSTYNQDADVVWWLSGIHATSFPSHWTHWSENFSVWCGDAALRSCFFPSLTPPTPAISLPRLPCQLVRWGGRFEGHGPLLPACPWSRLASGGVGWLALTAYPHQPYLRSGKAAWNTSSFPCALPPSPKTHPSPWTNYTCISHPPYCPPDPQHLRLFCGGNLKDFSHCNGHAADFGGKNAGVEDVWCWKAGIGG